MHHDWRPEQARKSLNRILPDVEGKFADQLAGNPGDWQMFKFRLDRHWERLFTYLHLMPLFAVPTGESDVGYAVSDSRWVHRAKRRWEARDDLADQDTLEWRFFRDSRHLSSLRSVSWPDARYTAPQLITLKIFHFMP